jgi:hypothetical protein
MLSPNSSVSSSALFRAAAKLRMLCYPDAANSIAPYKFSHEALLAGKNLIDEVYPSITINHLQAAIEMVLSYLVEETTEKTVEEATGETTEQLEEEGNGESKEDNQEAISLGTILPPFNFDTPQKLQALVGRKVRLRGGDVVEVDKVDLTCGLLEEVISTSVGWNYYNGQGWRIGESSLDIAEVLPKE